MTDQTHLQVGILMANQEARNFLANQWGKQGTSSDITLYTVSSSSLVQTSIVPEGYPKKPLSLVITAHLSDVVVLGVPVSGVDATVGESAILADCLQLPGIKAVVGEQTMGLDSYFEQMDKLFAKLSVKSWQSQMIYNGAGASQAREQLQALQPQPRGSAEDYLAIEVDHAFPVQGVGSVILGTVISGTVEKGQKIRIFPEKQEGTVRSIQVNDEDVRSAGPGVHVGLAMKGILPKFLQRGTVITAADQDQVIQTQQLDFNIKPAAFGEAPEVGDHIHLVSGLFDSPGEIIEWGNSVSIKTEKLVPFHQKIRMTVLDLNKKPAIVGAKI